MDILDFRARVLVTQPQQAAVAGNPENRVGAQTRRSSIGLYGLEWRQLARTRQNLGEVAR